MPSAHLIARTCSSDELALDGPPAALHRELRSQMSNPSFSRSVTALFTGAALSSALALAAGMGCGGTADTATSTAGAMSTSLGGSNAAGAAQGGGSSGTTSGGTSNIGGTSSSAGGTSSSAGSSSGGDSCATLTTQAACSARSDCYVITKVLECPGSSAPCPTVFARCSDNGCDPACATNSVCVSQLTQGGALILESDAGTCPAGTHPQSAREFAQCVRDPSYSCQPIPAACGSKVDCTCASSLCQGQGNCQSATSAQVSCVEDVP
jgi:hypothetical protein